MNEAAKPGVRLFLTGSLKAKKNNPSSDDSDEE